MATYKKPASMETSGFLEKEGQYHFLVSNIDEQPLNKDNSPVDAIRVEMSCVGGTDASQVKRLFNQNLFNPAESHRDGGEFASRVHLRLADACCLMGKAEAGDEVEIDWSKAKGAQIVAFCKIEKGKDGKDRLQIDGAHIYHVDDPEVAHVPKNEKMLALLPPDRRRVQKKEPPKQTQKPNGTGKATTPPTTTAAANQTFDPNDL